MKTVRLLLSCVAMGAMATTVAAAGLCIQGNGGCKDLRTDRVYVRSGNELVDPETQQPVMTIEPFQEHVVTEQDRRDTVRRKAEAIADAKADARRQRIEAANQRAWAYQAQAQAQAQAQEMAQERAQMQYQTQSSADGNSLPTGVSPSYFGTNGQHYQGVAGGIVNSTTGTFSQDVGAGFVNSQTGAFTPK